MGIELGQTPGVLDRPLPRLRASGRKSLKPPGGRGQCDRAELFVLADRALAQLDGAPNDLPAAVALENSGGQKQLPDRVLKQAMVRRRDQIRFEEAVRGVQARPGVRAAGRTRRFRRIVEGARREDHPCLLAVEPRAHNAPEPHRSGEEHHAHREPDTQSRAPFAVVRGYNPHRPRQTHHAHHPHHRSRIKEDHLDHAVEPQHNRGRRKCLVDGRLPQPLKHMAEPGGNDDVAHDTAHSPNLRAERAEVLRLDHDRRHKCNHGHRRR